jgi:amino-acid N-acetyltransferase
VSTPSTWTIAPARPVDLDFVRRLLAEATLPTAGLEAMGETLLVARSGGAIIGCAGLEVYGGSALLRSVAVAVSARGAGVGRALCAAAVELARGHGVHRIYLLTETAGGYFPRLGFQPVSRHVVDDTVAASEEFRSLCPSSATAMVLELDPGASSAGDAVERRLGGRES